MSSEMKRKRRPRADGGEFDPVGPPEAPPPDDADPWAPPPPAPGGTPGAAPPADPAALREAFDYLLDEDPPKPPGS
jgi:hypothetical protein